MYGQEWIEGGAKKCSYYPSGSTKRIPMHSIPIHYFPNLRKLLGFSILQRKALLHALNLHPAAKNASAQG